MKMRDDRIGSSNGIKQPKAKKKLVCPHCNRGTKVMVYEDTKLIRFPLYCSWCRKETVVNVSCFEVINLDGKQSYE